MALDIDPDIAAALAPIMAAAGDAPPPPVGDWATRRANIDTLLQYLGSLRTPPAGVEASTHTATADDGTALALSWYSLTGAQPGSAVLYIHGGGMILGSVAAYDALIRAYVAQSGVPMLAVEYRLAPEHPHPVPVEDCYTTLVWLADNAAELGVDPERLAVMGDSAGGGLAAAVALLARDRGGPRLAQQLLVYPMLDDRKAEPDPQITPFLTWTYDDNVTGWGALLGDAEPDAYAAPARADSLAGLPPAFIDVGDLDIFRDEDIAYARRLAESGVPAELHVHPGCPHAFEAFAPDAAVSQRAMADRVRRLRSL